MELFSKKVDTIPLLIMLLAPSVRLMAPSANALVLYIMIPCLFMWSYWKFPKLIKHKSIKYYFILLIWLLFTVFTSTDRAMSMSYMKTLVAGILASSIMYVLAASKLKNGIYISVSYILLLGTTILYLWNEGKLVNLDFYSERLNDELVNANDLAYYLFYVSCAFTILFFYSRATKFRKLLVYISLIALALWLSLITASRQILLVVIPYVLLCLVFHFFGSGRIRIEKVIPVVIIVALLMIPAFFYFEDLFAGSFLEERMTMKTADDSRSALLQDAIRVGLEHPILGVGPGCFVKFSNDGGFAHNSYAELFATSGIPAVIIYLMMTVPAMFVNKKRYKITGEPVFAFLFFTCVFWLLYNILYAFYTSLWLISFYFLLMGISDNLYYNRYRKIV